MRFIREEYLANWAPASTAMPADPSDESDGEHACASKKKRGALLEDSDFSEEEEDSDQDLQPENQSAQTSEKLAEELSGYLAGKQVPETDRGFRSV